MKGFGTDETALIRTLAQYPGPLIPHLKTTFQQRHNRSLVTDVEKETSGRFEQTLVSILRGPLDHDVNTVYKALKGMGTNEEMLNDVLIGRSNADIRAIKDAYKRTYNRNLDADVASDLSAKTERLFSMIVAANRQEDSAPVIPQNVDQDVSEIHRATEAKVGTDQLVVCSILSSRSDGQIRAIAHAYEAKFRIPLEKVITSEFSGHMKDALVQMVRAACDRAMRDAIRLEDCMSGAGTKDDLLISRLVSIHWNRDHVNQVKGAYKHRYKRDLISRIQGETSGDYEKILVAMIQ